MTTIYQLKNGYYYPFCEFRKKEEAENYLIYLKFNCPNCEFIIK